MKYLAVIFLGMPIIEMIVLIKVGGWLGVFPTILAVILTAVIGLSLLRSQGLSTLFSARKKLNEGQVPLQEMAEGIFLAVGGALLLTPGFVTDAIGFACLIPMLRRILFWRVLLALKSRVQPAHGASQASATTTIEGEFSREKSE